MKATVRTSQLKSALDIVSKAAAVRSNLPILKHVAIHRSNGSLIVTCNNLGFGARMAVQQIDGDSSDDDVGVCVPVARLVALLARIGDTVSLETVLPSSSLRVVSGGVHAIFHGMHAHEFPVFGSSDTEAIGSVNTRLFAQALAKAAIAAASMRDYSRPVLCSVALRHIANEWSLFAADGFRLSKVKLPGAVLDHEHTDCYIIPIDAVGLIRQVMAGYDEGHTTVLSVSPTGNNLHFDLGESAGMYSSMVDGRYPDIERIIPGNSTTTSVASRTEFLNAVRAVMVFGRDSVDIVRVKLGSGFMSLSCTSAELGEATYQLEATLQGNEMEFAVNGRYLQDYLAADGGQEVRVLTTKASSPLKFSGVDAPDFVHVIMPMHLGQ